MTYTVTAELKAEEMFNPRMFAKQETENRIAQKGNVIPRMSRMRFPTITKVSVWNADRQKRIEKLRAQIAVPT